MRNPLGPLYIVNLINQIVGKTLLASLTDNPTVFNTVWDVYKVIGRTLEEALQLMTPATLAGIIIYSDRNVVVGEPRITRYQAMAFVPKKPFYGQGFLEDFEDKVFHGYSGRNLLEKAALATLLMIIVDMIKQYEYRLDFELDVEERIGEFRRRHG